MKESPWLILVIFVLAFVVNQIYTNYRRRKLMKNFELYKDDHILLDVPYGTFSQFRTVRAFIRYGTDRSKDIPVHSLDAFPVPYGSSIQFLNSRDEEIADSYQVETKPDYQILRVKSDYGIIGKIIIIIFLLSQFLLPVVLKYYEANMSESLKQSIQTWKDYSIFVILALFMLHFLYGTFTRAKIKYVQRKLN